MAAKKSAKRVRIIRQIAKAFTSPRIFATIDYRNRNEDYIKQYLHQPLRDELYAIHRNLAPGVSAARNRKKADASIVWEGDVRTTINNLQFMGTQHRPDFEINLPDLRIAVEVKRGESGQQVREGLGQSLVYSQYYDFVIYVFVDTSVDKKVKGAHANPTEQGLLNALWEHFNIYFEVV